MGIGVGIFLVAIGAIMSFAVTDRISGVDLTMVGYILMAVGALGIVLVLVMNRQQAHTSHTSVQERRNINE